MVVTPRVGPSRERAQRRITFGQAGRLPKEAALSQREAELRERGLGGGPLEGRVDRRWRARGVAVGPGPGRTGTGPARPSTAASWPSARGGASDAFRPGGASDVHRR